MVKALHEAGIEVILDVVYNHTAEGDHRGPTLSFRGIDNAAYYRLADDDKRYYLDYTGCGNSFNVRYAARAPAHHGLAAVLGARSARGRVPFRPRVGAGPGTARRGPAVRLLRPGPAGPGGVPGQADRRALGRGRGRLPGGQLPAAVERVERQVPRHGPGLLARRAGDRARVRLPAVRLQRPVRDQRPPPRRLDQLRHLPRRLHAGRPGRPTTASTTRPTARAGRDGSDDNRSWNCGAEGPDQRPGRSAGPAGPAASATCWPRLFCSQGVPMLLAGDELGRTQGGNNNAYCQDNEVSWVDWELADEPGRACSSSPARWPRCAASTRCSGAAGSSSASRRGRRSLADIAWLTPSGRRDGRRRTGNTPYARAMTVFLNGDAITEPGPHGERVRDDSFLVMLSADTRRWTSRCPASSTASAGRSWPTPAAWRPRGPGGAEHRGRGG